MSNQKQDNTILYAVAFLIFAFVITGVLYWRSTFFELPKSTSAPASTVMKSIYPNSKY